jgi:hypothetical protein
MQAASTGGVHGRSPVARQRVALDAGDLRTQQLDHNRSANPGRPRPERATRVGGEMPGGGSRHRGRAIPRGDSLCRPPRTPRGVPPTQALDRRTTAPESLGPLIGSCARVSHTQCSATAQLAPAPGGNFTGQHGNLTLSRCRRGGNLGRCATRARALGLPEATPPRKFPANHTPVAIRTHQLRSSPRYFDSASPRRDRTVAGPTGSPLLTRRRARQARGSSVARREPSDRGRRPHT